MVPKQLPGAHCVLCRNAKAYCNVAQPHPTRAGHKQPLQRTQLHRFFFFDYFCRVARLTPWLSGRPAISPTVHQRFIPDRGEITTTHTAIDALGLANTHIYCGSLENSTKQAPGGLHQHNTHTNRYQVPGYRAVHTNNVVWGVLQIDALLQ